VEHSTGAAPAIRVYALLSVAQYNAVIAAEDAASGPRRPSPAAAVAGASAAVLTYLYPGKEDFFGAQVEAQAAAARWPGEQGTDFAAGEEIGRTVAAGLIARAATDGFFAPFTGTVPVCPGCWVAGQAPPAFATLGQAKTFFLTSGSQFRPLPPPDFGSAAFLADLAEVRQTSDTRTAAQDSIAKFWSLQGGTISPLGYWNLVASELAVRYHLNERQAARTLALMNAAGFDAVVASHEAKYTYWLIRPTQADPEITLAIALPYFPSYPSNHATISAAAATVLGTVFPADRGALEAAAVEAGVSRIYGGIHYRFDVEAGLEMGRKIGRYVLEQGPAGHEPLVLE
jgi:membrane-associated phospholipid phosphatase